MVEKTGLYWHFVDLVWSICIYILLPHLNLTQYGKRRFN